MTCGSCAGQRFEYTGTSPGGAVRLRCTRCLVSFEQEVAPRPRRSPEVPGGGVRPPVVAGQSARLAQVVTAP